LHERHEPSEGSVFRVSQLMSEIKSQKLIFGTGSDT
jgi:hypothetical protein